jgi:uncharacterized protein YaaN involved in tellurite resistance
VLEMGEMKFEKQEELKVPKAEEVREELAVLDPASIKAEPGANPAQDARAEEVATYLFDFGANDFEARQERKNSIESLGMQIQKKAAGASHMLKEPVKDLSKGGEEGGAVAKSLIDLKMQVEELDPGKFDFEAGWFTRMLGSIPAIGTPMKRYFTKYESAQTVISTIIRALTNGGEQLRRDNITLANDQKRMRELTLKLEEMIRLAQLIDGKVVYRLEREMGLEEEEKRKFIEEEILFPLRQRIMDLQQQLAVNQQGVLATELIIRNNKELVRGVNRVLNTTMTALEVAVAVAMALAHQRIVLEKIEAVNETTSDLIAGTASRLKTQGVAVQKQASSAQLDIDKLKSAFADIQASFDSLASFRREALPQMAATVLEMDKLTAESEKLIDKMEKGAMVRPSMSIDIE